MMSVLSLGMNFRSSRDKFAGFTASVLFHVALLTVGGIALIKPAQYGVDTGLSGLEIHLVAAPAEVVPAPVEEKKLEEEIIPQKDQSDISISVPEMTEMPPKPVEKKEPVLTAKDSPKKGDGSSSLAGESETTVHSSGKALTEAKPNYLKNPAPPYPWEAKKKGWEGVVLLKVLVDKNGDAVEVTVEKSSGYSLLDETALKTIKKWKFRPGQLGNIPVESSAKVPIKFDLEDS